MEIREETRFRHEGCIDTKVEDNVDGERARTRHERVDPSPHCPSGEWSSLANTLLKLQVMQNKWPLHATTILRLRI